MESAVEEDVSIKRCERSEVGDRLVMSDLDVAKI